jgi:hypothetical protein
LRVSPEADVITQNWCVRTFSGSDCDAMSHHTSSTDNCAGMDDDPTKVVDQEAGSEFGSPGNIDTSLKPNAKVRDDVDGVDDRPE